MAFTHTDKVPGDLIRSADWNDMGREVTRLNSDKVDLAGNQTVTGPLTVRADLTVGSTNTGAQLRILRRQENGTDAINHGALVLGTDSTSSASLRVGYDAAYSWLQGQGRQNLALNPRGGDVGVGTDNPRSKLSVAGGLAVGAAYAAANAAPANALIVEGNLGVGTPTPQYRLDVAGNARISGALDVTGALNFGQATRQMLNLWAANYGIGVQTSTTYFRSDANFAFYRGGTHSDTQLAPGTNGTGLMSILSTGNVGVGTMAPEARLHVAGGALKLDANQEIFFADNGQIRSVDNNHRILFRRSEDKLELREYGDIIFSSGATGGAETAKAVLMRSGNFGIGTTAPRSALDTGKGVMSGAANDYLKLQFTLSGGGQVTWIANRLKWTNRFIGISANRGTTFSTGYVDLYQPTTDIPAANVYNNAARSANADGVLLGDWDALYAVHTPGGGPGEIAYRIVNYQYEFNAPSNWILVAVRNGDNGAVRLGTGEILGGIGKLLLPSAGNSASAGIQFPSDPGGGGGDAAWLRWYARTGEACTLEIGTSNDADDHIALMPAGSVGIGINSPSRKFHIRQPSGGNGFRLDYGANALNIHWEEGNNNVVFYRDNGIGRWMDTSGNWNHNSDLALKDDVMPVQDALADVLRLRPVRFRWKHNGEPDIGMIAQEVEEVYPQLVSRLDNGSRGLAYDTFGVVAIAALQELARVVDEQERRIGELTRQINGESVNA
ncbi:MAG TPA: tail fiber domain-containing protein [Longimicrobium sp.]|nr:tail fiber domain-containing protein [Longimicrobium sp.]